MIVDGTKLKFAKSIRKVEHDGVSTRDGFRLFATVAACAVAYPHREAEYLQAIKPYPKKILQRFQDETFPLMVQEMEEHRFLDVLGPAYMELVGPNDRSGEFYTPPPISKVMAMMTLPASAEEWNGELMTACEPACGAGGMILAARETMQEIGVHPRLLEWTAIDISRTAADLCYVNMTLYGVPGTVVHGNALTNEVFGAWRTRWTPMRRLEPESEFEPESESEFQAELTRDERALTVRRLVEGDIWPKNDAVLQTIPDGTRKELTPSGSTEERSRREESSESSPGSTPSSPSLF